MSEEILFYSDGGCHGNPGPGGWGFWGNLSGECLESWGGQRMTTNNQMELMAAIRALQSTPVGSLVRIKTDSQYVVKGVHEWRAGWIAKAWKGVKNTEIWKLLLTEVDLRQVRFEWVRGHSGDPGNEHADRLAQDGIALLSKGPQNTCEATRRRPIPMTPSAIFSSLTPGSLS